MGDIVTGSRRISLFCAIPRSLHMIAVIKAWNAIHGIAIVVALGIYIFVRRYETYIQHQIKHRQMTSDSQCSYILFVTGTNDDGKFYCRNVSLVETWCIWYINLYFITKPMVYSKTLIWIFIVVVMLILLLICFFLVANRVVWSKQLD